MFELDQCAAVESESVVRRFGEEYERFTKRGGIVGNDIPRRRYDVVVATYVIETICPPAARSQLLKKAAQAIAPGGALVISVRGYPGIRGRSYRRCVRSDGFVSARGAFVRGYDLAEIGNVLRACGLGFEPLQHYRTERPENIHGIAKVRID
jgi:hypothetical protein